MSDQPKPVDLNKASADELARIPGIGPAIAARIQSERPFQTLDDLTNVPGIGEVALGKIRHYFIPLSGADGQESSDEVLPAETESYEAPPLAQIQESDVIALPAPEHIEMLDASTSADEIQEEQTETDAEPAGEPELPATELPEVELAAAEEPPEIPQVEQETGPTVVIPKSEPATKEQPRYASRADVFWIAFGSSFLAFILALGLTLGVLALINNGLRYVSPAQLNSVSRQLDGLSSQASILQQDLDGMRVRVDNLEGLSGRVSTVEQSAKELRGDLDAAAIQVEQLNQNISGLQTDVTELKSVTNKFQSFLDGLRELLNNEQQ